MVVLDQDDWLVRRDAHARRVDAWIGPHLQRRQRGESHAVEDFLFTYYSYRPAALRRWHPGIGVTLAGPAVRSMDGVRGYAVREDHARLAAETVRSRAATAGWVRELLVRVASRPPALGCFGLHEWAMVYRRRPEELRHPGHGLRLGHAGTDAVVESHRLACSHFDAFRFFTEPARPLNTVQPTRDAQQRLEQPGCLHATMDLYKWAYKLSPCTPAELVADCFELARDVRRVDMAAAPYDLSELGIEPVRIETADGKARYIAHQRDFAARAEPLRARLIDVCERVLEAAAG